MLILIGVLLSTATPPASPSRSPGWATGWPRWLIRAPTKPRCTEDSLNAGVIDIAQLREPVVGSWAGSRLATDGEIGRARCWGRGGHYVETSVGAGYIKTK